MDERNRKIALIHIARKELGLSDASYRALLEGAAGITSCSDLRTYEQYRAIVAAFQNAGFRWRFSSGGENADGYRNGHDATTRQIDAIYRLWGRVSRCKDDAALEKFVKRTTGVDFIAWLSKKDASSVITALKKMAG